MSEAKQKFRVGVAWYAFAEIEIDATDHDAAVAIGETLTPPVPVNCGPVVHRVEQRVPVPGKPGEFHWQKIDLFR